TFFKESRAPPPESAGDSRRRVHPATVPTELLPMTEGPGPLSPHFSGEMGTPAGQAAPRGAAPQGQLRSGQTVGYADLYNPSSSGNPSIKFMFCTAAPEAPLPRLSKR